MSKVVRMSMPKDQTQEPEFKIVDTTQEPAYGFSDEKTYETIAHNILNKQYDHVIYLLLSEKKITRKNTDYFKECVIHLLNTDKYYSKILDNIITLEDDHDLYLEVLKTIAQDENRCTCLIPDIINKYNNRDWYLKIYKIFAENNKNYIQAIKNYFETYNIDEKDEELFRIAIESLINVEINAFNILKSNIVTKEHGDLFTQTINAVKKPQLRDNLVKCGIIEE